MKRPLDLGSLADAEIERFEMWGRKKPTKWAIAQSNGDLIVEACLDLH